MIGTLLVLAGGIYVVLGGLHALYTFLDIRNPRRIVPDDPAVTAAMAASHVRLTRGGTTVWRAWVGFNLSHSLGAILFGALCILTGASLQSLAVPQWVLLLFTVISALYLVMAIRYWFRIPVGGTAIATACCLVAWLMYTL